MGHRVVSTGSAVDISSALKSHFTTVVDER